MQIVLVDGSRTGLMILKRMLDARGDEIAMFTDGEQALDFVRANPDVELIITSFEISNRSGTEICWEARLLADAGRPLYVIAMSASDDPQHVIGVLDAGADDFMAKPPRPDELHARLRVAERTLLMQRRLIAYATIDQLSGILNRRAFRDRADKVMESLPDDGVASLILFDVDHFKQVNDNYGHEAGDDVIRRVGLLRTPPDSLFGRVGGEEFAIMLQDVPLDGAVSVADYLREQLENEKIETQKGPIRVTASFGVSEAGRNGSVTDLFRTADTALYHAKHSGRNRVATMTGLRLS